MMSFQIIERDDIQPLLTHDCMQKVGVFLHHEAGKIELALSDEFGLFGQFVI